MHRSQQELPKAAIFLFKNLLNGAVRFHPTSIKSFLYIEYLQQGCTLL